MRLKATGLPWNLLINNAAGTQGSLLVVLHISTRFHFAIACGFRALRAPKQHLVEAAGYHRLVYNNKAAGPGYYHGALRAPGLVASTVSLWSVPPCRPRASAPSVPLLIDPLRVGLGVSNQVAIARLKRMVTVDAKLAVHARGVTEVWFCGM
jgi:hypothetical protein